MPDVSPSEIDRHNQQALEELCRLLRFSQGEFELILAVCNSTRQRQGLVQQLRQQCSVSFAEITLDPSTTTLFTTIRSAIGSPPPEALMVYGLDGVHDLQQLLTATNQIREEFRQFPFPLVLWLTDDGLKQLIRTAPDFYTWANSITFATPPEFFLAFLDQLIADVGRQVVESRENRFLSNQELGLTPGSARCRELEASLEVLATQGMALTPEQSAGLAFVQGRIADNNTPEAREHYEDSLAQWQALVAQNPNASAIAQWQENVGHGQFYLGLWWLNYSVRHHREFEPACQQACRYFEQAVQTFDQAQRPELMALYINYWAGALHRLEAWEALESVANRARLLHQAQANPVRQARAEGFLAEVDLAHENYGAAQSHAEAALALIQPFADSNAEASVADRDFYAWVNSFHRSWYVFSLGKAQMGQGQVDAAVQTLEQVPTITQQEYDPLLYSQTLEYLRRGYFEQGHYLQAFETRREKEAIESRFNFRAFVGAGRLQPKQQITNPALPTGDHGPDLIIASGRRQDVSRLVTRLEQDEFVLTVVYGPSGVGKSSLIEAGLVPTLEQQRFGGRQVVPVRLRSYGNWVEEVLSAMPRPAALAESVGEKAADLETLLLDLLRQQTQVNRFIVLIFDQFEEFFFACDQPAERLRFYRFLGDCLAMPFIKVVLSLREDYTHYLLECNRLTNLAIIDDNILDKKWIYYLGNFSPADARGVIDDLTQPTPYAPAPDLVERVVADLAAEAGEVRPIELQIVGSQLQSEGIATLADYQGWPHTQTSIKAALVQQYLNDVVRDCGPVTHQQLASLVLYLLTDERGTRPLKTQTELLNDLHTFTNHTELDAEAFGLVLQVLTQSGLVVQVPNAPDDRYQLVHDYLAAFLRSSQQPLMAQLAQERQMRVAAEQQRIEEQRKRIEAERQKLRQTRLAAIGLGSLAAVSTGIGAFAWVQQQQGLTDKINAQTLADSLAMETYLEAGFEEVAVTQAMLTGQALQSGNATRLKPHTRFRAISSVREVIYGVKERERLIGHSGEIWSVAFSPDGQTIATASGDNTVKLWSIKGEELQTLNGHSSWVKSVAFSPDGQTIATASDDNTVKLWSVKGEELQTLNGHSGAIWHVAFSPDGQTIATASNDRTAKLWSLEGKELQTLNGHLDGLNSIVFSSDGKTIATASDDRTVKLWNRNGEEIKTLKGHDGSVSDVVFSPSGQTIATAGGDNTVKLWNLEGKELKSFNGHSDSVYSVAFSSDGQTIATAGGDNTVKLWNLEGKELKSFNGHNGSVYSVAFSPDGQTIASASNDRTAKLWSRESQELQTLKGHSDAIWSVAFSPDGQTIATASRDNTVKLWNRNGEEIKTLNGHDGAVSDVVFSPSGQTIATASRDNTVKLWNRNGEEIKTLKGHSDVVNSIDFSPDGQTIATASDDNTVKLWSVKGEELQTLNGHDNWVLDIAFSPDNQMIATISWDNKVKLWNRSGKELKTLEDHSSLLYSVIFSPDSQIIATTGVDNNATLWSLEGKELQTLKGHSNVIWSVAFSPDGQTVATASKDNTVKLWNKAGEELQTLEGHSDDVSHVTFSPDGETLATASRDRTVKLWNFQLADLTAKGCDWLSTYFIKQSPELLIELPTCQERDPSLRVAAAPMLVTQGEKIARNGNLKQARELFQQAIAWDSSLDIDPKTKAQNIAQAQTLVDEADELAQVGKISEATAKLAAAKPLDSTLDFEPETRAKELAVQGYLANGDQLLNDGNVAEAVAAYRQADALNLKNSISADDWNSLCWDGSTYNQAEAVMFACDKAVALSPNDGGIIDSRGLARALTGDTEGAIADFQAYIEWNNDEEEKEQRQGWIEALEQGKNPFTPEVLESLR
ncbi:eIF2A-related protein [Phormidium tenue]|uniref:Intraflagellar transport protein 122 homolog n=1 Tax=Phormidium tenue NIES-30 TaxID=549789 RepID=A0A1U7J4M1_9CYAN|nr:hypothetical protein [Phormidium tenue]MBD2232902.1 hypothetical protein [Phormidium tenue FACHB-1052]OKH47419.1 hypothetical protein NIES30_13165 [Phormidium tenue NIES-30]